VEEAKGIWLPCRRIRTPSTSLSSRRPAPGDRVESLPTEHLILDIGSRTIAAYAKPSPGGDGVRQRPAGAYENSNADAGTGPSGRRWPTPGHTVIGGGDTVSSAKRFIDTGRIDVVSTGGGP